MTDLPESKTFDTYMVASALTGIALGPCCYADIAEIASMLFGAPIWTHELVHKPTKAVYCDEGFRQFPDMPTKAEAEADWKAARDKAEAAYGHFVEVKRGKHGRRESPVTTLSNMVGEDKVIVVKAGSERTD